MWCAELLDAYKKVAKEKVDTKSEFDELSEKYKLLCESKSKGNKNIII